MDCRSIEKTQRPTMLKMCKHVKDGFVTIMTKEVFFESHFSFKCFEDRIEFTQRGIFYEGKIKRLTKREYKTAPSVYLGELRTDYSLGDYETHIEGSVLTIYKPNNQ